MERKVSMATSRDPKQVISFEELLMSQSNCGQTATINRAAR
jgi:hypothetical protein